MIYIKVPGPIFFTQERIGRNGRHFKIYKFRTMCQDAEPRLTLTLNTLKLNSIKTNWTNVARYDINIM